MKVKIGGYINWIGPYQIAEMILFWIPKYDKTTFECTKEYDKYVYGFGEWLAQDKNGNDSWLTKLCHWIQSKRNRTIKVHIDDYDVWSMDSTLALIILPMLKKLKERKQGSAFVDLEDVPESMRKIDHEEWDDQKCFDFYREPDLQKTQCDVHDRWNWVMDEIIWTFEQIVDDDNTEQFHSGENDLQWDPCEYDEDGKPKMYKMKHGPNHTAVFDAEGYHKHYERMQNGLRLFGRYYSGLWD
jgi:hypothetical protein